MLPGICRMALCNWGIPGNGLFCRELWAKPTVMPPDTKMLPPDSPRWKSFSVHFGTPEQVPERLASWRESIGGPDEASNWSDLWEQFLHQGTITDAAYAAVPHIVRELERIAPMNRLNYLVEVAEIESARHETTSPRLPPISANLFLKGKPPLGFCAFVVLL